MDRIYWALYSRDDDHCNEGDRLATIELVHDIRQQNNHVYYDIKEQQVWLFNLLGSQEGTNHEQLVSRGYLSTLPVADFLYLADEAPQKVSTAY